jgi:hypothetical protein
MPPVKKPAENEAAAQTSAPAAVAAAATTAGGGVTFNFVFNGVTYTVDVYAPDSSTSPQYGFKVTQAANTVASLTYQDENNWEIVVGLPQQLQIDTNLTLTTLNVNLKKGTPGTLTPAARSSAR